MSDLHPIDRTAMTEVEGGRETYTAYLRWNDSNGVDANCLPEHIATLSAEDRVRGASLRGWLSSADIDAALHEKLDGLSDSKVDALDSRAVVRPIGLFDNSGGDGAHSHEGAAIHVGQLGSEVDGELHQRRDNGALLFKVAFEISHRFVSGFVRLIKALFGGRVE